ncbi:alpha/beta hydrolase [Bacillus cereus]
MRLSLLLTCLFAALAAPSAYAAPLEAPGASASTTTRTAAATPRSGVLPVDGVDYYYELHGQGEPLLLLHGGLGSGAMFGPVLSALAQRNTVILVDLQGHGRTALGERAFGIEAMGDDRGALVQRLGYDRVDVVGYSLGGGVALRMAVQRPAQVRKLVLVSSSYSNDAFYPAIGGQQKGINASAAPMFKGTPMYESYVAVAPKPDDFPRLLDAIGGFLSRPFNWSADVSKLQGPVMLVYGDSDLFRPESEIAFFQLLGGGKRDGGWQREGVSNNRLAILPGVTHYEIASSPLLAQTLAPFLAEAIERGASAPQAAPSPSK